MVQRAELSVPAFVRILIGGMSKEPAVSVLQILHMTAARLMAVTADPRWLPAGKEQLATAALRAAGGRRARQRSSARLDAAAWLDCRHARAARLPRRPSGRERGGPRAGRRHRAALGPAAPAGRDGPRRTTRRSTPSSRWTRPTRAAGTRRPPVPRSRTPSTRRRRGALDAVARSSATRAWRRWPQASASPSTRSC